MDFDVAALVRVGRQPEVPWLWEGSMVLGVDLDMNPVEFLDNATDVKGCEISRPAVSFIARHF